jgi:multifunctional methyltransferase subunit TRM112
VDKNHHLKLFIEQSQIIEKELRPVMVKKLAYKLNWALFVSTASSIGQEGLPETLEDSWLEVEENVKSLHNMLFQFEVIEGKLVCENCERVYQVKEGIPNLILEESEI